MATVYRNLGILVDREEIRKISIMGEPDRYDKKLAVHERIFGDKCKKVMDINIDDF